MSKLKNVLLATGVAIALTGAAAPVVFAKSHQGGEWNYGAHHEPGNWGAFSNYYHRTRNHWSQVVSKKDSRSNYKEAGATHTSYAFLNTGIGESVSFGAGVK